MTTANLMNVPSVNNMNSQVDTSKKLQEENLEVAEVFAGLMNQTVEISNSVVDDTSSNMDVSKTNSTQSPVESYERYSYKDNQIDAAEETNVSEKLEEAGEALEQVGEEVIDTLCEEYGLDQETIQNLLDEMGLSALDLLNPQNLVSFIVALTGVASGEELLLDENFLNVMETLDNLAEGLMKDLGVDMNGLQELVAEMDIVNTETEGPTTFQDTLEVELENATVEADITENDTIEADAEAVNKTEAVTVEVEMEATEQTTNEAVNETVENTTDETEPIEVKVEKQEDTSEVKAQDVDTEDITTSQSKGEDSSLAGGKQNSENNSLLNHNSDSNQAIVTNQTTINLSQVNEMPQMQFNSYLSADTVQIMEQIVQQMKINITSEMTSMEMQLNPENLGKVYVNISSEEGVVNAQFHATNEVVKEALETQIATLRENLNQAGVKVDAIEVTIASHEFERNLEQNQQNPEEHVEAEENKHIRRRNITMDSLDELAGLMTEEETLVAQIMKDNGNSVDLTA